MTSPHTNYPKGKRVRIKLCDGSIIVDKFIEKTGKYIVTEHHRLRGRDIVAMSSFKSRDHENTNSTKEAEA